MSGELVDQISSNLLDALDKLTNDINRKILQVTLDQGTIDTKKLHSLFEEHRGVSYQSFISKIHMMEQVRLLDTELAKDGRNIETIRLTTFGEILIRGLLVAQKLLEAKP